jgi:S-DNA-T family DNA segregation ATPase FtsK/SpoIIIE
LFLLVPSVSLLATVLHQLRVLPGGRVERPGGYLGDEIFRLLLFFFGTFGLAVLALTGLALAVISLSERSFVSLLAWPSAGLNWLLARFQAALAGLKRRRVATRRAARKRPEPIEVPPPVPLDEPAVAEETVVPPAPPVVVHKEREKETKPSAGQQALPFLAPSEGYTRPTPKFLDAPSTEPVGTTQDEMAQNSRLLEKKLLEFGVEGHVTAVNPGPVITSYELEPGPGIKINRIVALADDLALGLKAMSVRVVAPIPGKAAVGVEIPNQHRATVYLRDVLATKEFANEALQLPLALGKDSGGAPLIADLTQMPHLLIAGETGPARACASTR